jgi:sporulation protein YlmC with PRC-barrel domain
MKRFLMTTAFVAATALPIGFGTAYAQSAGDTAAPQSPAVAPVPDQTQSPATAAPAPTAAVQTPPPSDAIIAAQGNGDLRADKMIGMKVYNPDGEEVGKVKDVLFDPNGNIKGVVLNVGGVLGIGAKPVGLQWKELDVQPSSNVMKVNYTKEQLEAAPSFQAADAADASVGSDTSQPAQPMTPAAPSPTESAPAPSQPTQ